MFFWSICPAAVFSSYFLLITVSICFLPFSRQVDEGVWNTPENLNNPSPKQTATDGEFSKSTNFELPSSPPTNFSQMNESQTHKWEPVCHTDAASFTTNPTRGEMVTVKTQTVSEAQNKKVGAEKSVEVRYEKLSKNGLNSSRKSLHSLSSWYEDDVDNDIVILHMHIIEVLYFLNMNWGHLKIIFTS